MPSIWRRVRDRKWDRNWHCTWVCGSKSVGFLIYIFIHITWKLVGGYDEGILGNVLVRVRVAFLPNYPLVLSLLKHKGVGAFLN